MPRVRKKVLFPDMLDPVTKSTVPSVSRARSFVTRCVSEISGWARPLAESLACAIAPRITFPLSPRFIEAAAALTIAYLAFEIILLPNSGMRWLVVGVLGLFHGAYFSIFLAETGYHAATFLCGVTVAELLLIAVFAFTLDRLIRFTKSSRAVPVAAGLLLAVGAVWFLWRLK